MSKKLAVIIGGGPAGLTAALELVRRSDIRPIVLEAGDDVGGISRTVVHNGNRMDIGGHRFFSKSDWVMRWWRDILPLETEESGAVEIAYQNQRRSIEIGDDVPDGDKVMLLRNRLSRIYFLKKFFDYPIRLSLATLRNLGVARVLRIGTSYVAARLFPRRPESSLEDFLINRFGRALYLTFFKDYTEKVWGVPCERISAEWGAQRIKGLSITAAVVHALRKLFSGGGEATKTSLIERFLYPRLGPGQLWQEVARRVREGGGEVRLNHTVIGVELDRGHAVAVRARDAEGVEWRIDADVVLSTMPVRDLVLGLTPPPPANVVEVAAALPYRDFLTVGLLLDKMRPNPQSRSTQANHMPPDNWIYIQEREVKLGRLQIFNNWSPGLIADPDKIWLGLEYFCAEGDALWSLPDDEMTALAVRELAAIGLADPADVRDSKVLRVPKAYPAYFGAYERFDEVRGWLDGIDNLYLIGRNGMHRYNNQDHSMLTAKSAVDAIIAGQSDKAALWAINIDDEYHEEKQQA